MRAMPKKGSVTINLTDPEFLKTMLDAGELELRQCSGLPDREIVERVLRACVSAKKDLARKTLAARKLKTKQEWRSDPSNRALEYENRSHRKARPPLTEAQREKARERWRRWKKRQRD